MSRYGRPIRSILLPFGVPILAGLLAAAAPVGASDDSSCRRVHYDARAHVRYVIDGDTVILDDGSRIRLIGIDTPELGHNGNPDQPYARQARAYLLTLLHGHHDRISIIYGRQRIDAYRRTLGHIFLPDGSSIEALILARGLATPLVIPPNLGLLDCYRVQAQTAIDHRRGIWQQPQYQPRPVSSLTRADHGFRIIRGKITHIGHSRSSVWLDMGRTLGLRIVKNDLKYFAKLDIAALAGMTVEARGLIYRRNGQFRMRLRHPVSIRTLGE